ncbi:MAG TPA: hypothetical protein VGF54_15100 [Streptosporangiaceae bacterium]|jgi:hypothetical protein
MTVTAFGGLGEQDPGRGNPELDAPASAAVSVWMHDHQAVTAELEEAVRAHTHLQELEGRARQAAAISAAAQQRAASLTSKLDPDGHRLLGFGAGTAVVTVLTVLDAVPLNWAAQAFGLDSAGTWLITGILLVASVGAMAGLELTRGNARRRAALAAVIAVAYLALVVLRTQFLTAVSGTSPVAALLQAVLLSAISAGLVLCGSAVMARTRSLRLERARTAARRARQAAAAAQAAVHRAAEKMQRHLGVLRQMLIPWALASAAPAGVDHASWTAALERAIRALFPGL